MDKFLVSFKKVMQVIVELLMFLLVMGILLQLIFGVDVPFLGLDIVGNITSLLDQMGEAGVVGLIALAVIVYLFNKARAP